MIASNQLEYFRRRGWKLSYLYEILLIALIRPRRFVSAIPGCVGARLAVTDICEFSFRAALCPRADGGRRSFEDLAAPAADLFLTNYVFSAPWPCRCRGAARKSSRHESDQFVCAIAERSKNPRREPTAPAADAFCWRLEVELYRLFDRVLSINEEESRIVEPLCPGRTVAVPPMMPWEGRTMREPTSGAPLATAGDSFDLIFVGSKAVPMSMD